jgi:hypothetical protein
VSVVLCPKFLMSLRHVFSTNWWLTQLLLLYEPSLLQIPFLAPAFCCSPSGYTQDGDRLLPCSPLTTPEVVYLFLRAGSACSQDLIESVRSALLDFLTHPDTAFGEQCVWLAFHREGADAGGRSDCMTLCQLVSDSLTKLLACSSDCLPACLPLPAGVYTPSVIVHVVCHDVPVGEVG